MLLTLDSAFYRRLAVTAAALIVYRLGCAVPVPGLSTDVDRPAAPLERPAPRQRLRLRARRHAAHHRAHSGRAVEDHRAGRAPLGAGEPRQPRVRRLCNHHSGAGHGGCAGDRPRRRARRHLGARHRAGRSVSHRHRGDHGRRRGAADCARRRHRQGGSRLRRAPAVPCSHARGPAVQPVRHRRCLQRRHLSPLEHRARRPVHRLRRCRGRWPRARCRGARAGPRRRRRPASGRC